MKMFWKIFLSVVIVTMLVFCISGHLLLASFFYSSIQEKVDVAEKTNLSFLFSLRELAVFQDGSLEKEDWELAQIARNVRVTDVPGLWQICVYNASGREVFSSREFQTEGREKKLIRRAQEDITAYGFVKEGDNYFLCLANKARENHKTLFSVMSVMEVTEVFAEREEQYEIFLWGMCFLIILIALVAFFLAFWITKPIQKLFQGVKKVGAGDFSQKIEVKSQDEIGKLADEFNKMSNQVETMIEELREAARRQEEFTGSFAHELKTPLTSVIGYADMLRSKKMTEETRMLYGNQIFQQGKRLEMLSGKMLDLIVLGNVEFVRQEVQLSELLEKIAKELEFLLQEKEILFEYQVGENVIFAEPDLIYTVFLNLIDNARKAVGQGGKIRVCAAKKGQKIMVSISDDGKGMSEETIKRATESFYVEDKSRKYEENSAGLGLSICKKILELHHTELQIDSEIGKGTTICVWFESVL